MKKFLFSLLVLSSLFLFSNCKKSINEVDNITTSENIKVINDIEFQDLIVMNTELVEQITYPKVAAKLLKGKQNLKKEELILLAKSMGFKSPLEMDKFFYRQNEIVENINYKYPFLKGMAKDELQQLVNAGISKVKARNNSLRSPKMLLAESGDSWCIRKFNNCNSSSHAIYTGEVLACTATAIGVGAGTFGLGGVLFQVACGSVAVWHLNTMLADCRLDLEKCQNPNID